MPATTELLAEELKKLEQRFRALGEARDIQSASDGQRAVDAAAAEAARLLEVASNYGTIHLPKDFFPPKPAFQVSDESLERQYAGLWAVFVVGVFRTVMADGTTNPLAIRVEQDVSNSPDAARVIVGSTVAADWRTRASTYAKCCDFLSNSISPATLDQLDTPPVRRSHPSASVSLNPSRLHLDGKTYPIGDDVALYLQMLLESPDTYISRAEFLDEHPELGKNCRPDRLLNRLRLDVPEVVRYLETDNRGTRFRTVPKS